MSTKVSCAEYGYDDDGAMVQMTAFLPSLLVSSIARRWRISYNAWVCLAIDSTYRSVFEQVMNEFPGGKLFNI